MTPWWPHSAPCYQAASLMVRHEVGTLHQPQSSRPLPGPPAGHTGPLMNSVIRGAMGEDGELANEWRHRASEGMEEAARRHPPAPHCLYVGSRLHRVGYESIPPQ